MRTNGVLGVIAVALAVPTGLTIYSESGSFQSYEDVPRLFEGFTPDKIAAIQLSKIKVDEKGEPVKGANDQPERESLVFQKNNKNEWVIAKGKSAGAPVREDAIVTNVLQHMEKIRRDAEALVESDADDATLEEYELTDEKGLTIVCVDANNRRVAELVKGRNASDATAGTQSLRGHFVRRREYKDVVLYEQDYWNISLEPSQWIDRNVIPRTAAAEVVSVSIKNDQGEVAFKKDKASDTEWKLVKGPEGVGAVRQAEVNSRVSRLARASVVDFLQALPPDTVRRSRILQQFGLVKPQLTATLTLEDGTVYKIDVGNKIEDQNQYRAVFSSRDFVVSIADWVKTSFEFDPQELFDPSAESIQDGNKPAGDGNKPDGKKDDAGKKQPKKAAPKKQ